MSAVRACNNIYLLRVEKLQQESVDLRTFVNTSNCFVSLTVLHRCILTFMISGAGTGCVCCMNFDYGLRCVNACLARAASPWSEESLISVTTASNQHAQPHSDVIVVDAATSSVTSPPHTGDTPRVRLTQAGRSIALGSFTSFAAADSVGGDDVGDVIPVSPGSALAAAAAAVNQPAFGVTLPGHRILADTLHIYDDHVTAQVHDVIDGTAWHQNSVYVNYAFGEKQKSAKKTPRDALDNRCDYHKQKALSKSRTIATPSAPPPPPPMPLPKPPPPPLYVNTSELPAAVALSAASSSSSCETRPLQQSNSPTLSATGSLARGTSLRAQTKQLISDGFGTLGADLRRFTKSMKAKAVARPSFRQLSADLERRQQQPVLTSQPMLTSQPVLSSRPHFFTGDVSIFVLRRCCHVFVIHVMAVVASKSDGATSFVSSFTTISDGIIWFQ